jgi:hypothetical protein
MFLSWKDVRKNVKNGKQDTNAEAEELAADDENVDKQVKSKKMKVSPLGSDYRFISLGIYSPPSPQS